MARPKKEKAEVEKVEEQIKEVAASTVESEKDDVVVASAAAVAEEKSEPAKEVASKSGNVELTSEQKEALSFCLKWLTHLRRNSRNVEFRAQSQEAMRTLSKLL